MLSAAASTHAQTLTTVIPSSTISQGSVAYSPTGYIFVSSYVGDDIEVISDSSNSMVADLTVAQGAPYGLAYDSVKGLIWVATSGGATAISDTPPFSTVTTVADTNGFEYAAFDPQTGDVFMCFQSYMSVISDSTYATVANVTQADGSLFSSSTYVDDSAKSEIFAISSTGISVISAKTNKVTDTISLSGNPAYLAYDSGLGEIFVGNSEIISGSSAYTIQTIKDSNNQVYKTISIPTSSVSFLGPMAYNPNKGEIYISSTTLVAIVSDKTNSYVGSVNTNGTSGGALAFDSATNSVYVVNSEGSETGTLGSMAVISDPPGSSSPTSAPTSTTGNSATSKPTSTPKVPEFSSPALALIAAIVAAATLCTVASAKKTRLQRVTS